MILYSVGESSICQMEQVAIQLVRLLSPIVIKTESVEADAWRRACPSGMRASSETMILLTVKLA